MLLRQLDLYVFSTNEKFTVIIWYSRWQIVLEWIGIPPQSFYPLTKAIIISFAHVLPIVNITPRYPGVQYEAHIQVCYSHPLYHSQYKTETKPRAPIQCPFFNPKILSDIARVHQSNHNNHSLAGKLGIPKAFANVSFTYMKSYL